MLTQPRPSIRRLIEPIKPAKRTPVTDMVTGPISSLERNPQSPRGWKNREMDGVGLGIVAALGRSDGHKRPEKIAVGTPIKCISAPITIGSPGVGFHGPKCVGLSDGPPPLAEDLWAFRPADFLSQCYLCTKKLHGKDIYMYR